MRAVIYEKYGSPNLLQFKEIEKPVPKENEVLIKIHFTTVTAVDSIFRSGEHFFARLATGPLKPKNKILGTEFSGVIETVGKSVKKYKPGDPVFGNDSILKGTHTEYICLPEDSSFTLKPDNISLEEAASIPYGTLTALPFIRDSGNILNRNDKKVLIIGASGSVGSYAVQLAKYFRAEVTGVCSTANIELVKSLGADKVIDYSKEDFRKNGENYSIIFDTVGKSSFSRAKKSLTKDGIFLTAVINVPILFQMLTTSIAGSKKAAITFTGLRKPEEKVKDLQFIKELIESGKLKPVIDKCYSFDEIVEAHRYVDTGHKKGNVVIKL